MNECSAAQLRRCDLRRSHARSLALAVGPLALLSAATGALAVEPRETGEEGRQASARSQVTAAFSLGLMRPRRSVELTDPEALFVRLQRGGLIDERLSMEALRKGTAEHVRPIASASVPVEFQAKLVAGFSLALSRLRDSASCRGLFEQLRADGSVVLATTIYMTSTEERTEQMCVRGGAAAYTWLGQPATYLCPSFAGLPRHLAAMSLLHEALHYAGLPERPVHRGAMSSGEISALVRERCAL